MKADFSAWISANLTVEHMNGNEWTCVCPACGKTKLAVNIVKEAFQCWTCKLSGRRAAKLVSVVLGLSEPEAASHLATNSLAVAQTSIKPLAQKSLSNREVLPRAPLPPGTKPLQGKAMRYALSRGISAENAALFGLSSVFGDNSGSRADRLLAGRLLIPVFDSHRRLVYWIARATDDHPIKTINLPSADRHAAWGLPLVANCATRSEVLVGLHTVSSGSRVVVVEGPMDVAVCGAGFVATMGASMSPRQAAVLAATGAAEAVILYDPDDAGRKGAQQVKRALSPYLPTVIATCPDGSDPADMGRQNSLKIADSAQTEKLAELEFVQGIPARRLRRKSGWISPLKK